jgi:MYXO-CTERM domain-containing protein
MILMRRLLSGMAGGAILLLACPALQAAAIKLVPSASSVQVGSSFTVDVIAESLLIGGYTMDLSYAPGLVSMPLVDFAVFGTTLGNPDFSFSDAVNLFGNVRLDELSFLGEPELRDRQGNPSMNSFLLATLSFRADAPGSAAFDFSGALVSSPDGSILDPALTGATVDIVRGTSPAPVPEPGTWSAAAMGVAGLWLWRRKSAN